MKTSQNPKEKKIDNTSVYTPSYDDNSKINFNPPPLCFEDISDFDENKDEKEQVSNNKKSDEIHYDANAAYNASLSVPPNTAEQSVSKNNADMRVAKKRPKVKHKRADNKPSGYNYCSPSRFDSAVMAYLNIQSDNEEDEYFY